MIIKKIIIEILIKQKIISKEFVLLYYLEKEVLLTRIILISHSQYNMSNRYIKYFDVIFPFYIYSIRFFNRANPIIAHYNFKRNKQ